jgi:hypothetical protein
MCDALNTPRARSLGDDHTALNEPGIPSSLVIDFDYGLTSTPPGTPSTNGREPAGGRPNPVAIALVFVRV